MAKKSDGEAATKRDNQYRLTPLGCLYAVLKDYAGEDGMLNVNKIQGRYGEHIVEELYGRDGESWTCGKSGEGRERWFRLIWKCQRTA